MAQITLKYDARNSIAKKTIDYILSLGVFQVEKNNTQKDNEDFINSLSKQTNKKLTKKLFEKHNINYSN